MEAGNLRLIQFLIMNIISDQLISTFGLVLQEKVSPDGYPIYIAESLSNNQPTVFFELITDKQEHLPHGGSGETRIRITKAGAINSLILSLPELGSQTFTDLQQQVESALQIPG